ncbi:MAG: glutamine amidotransferase-related protein [Nitrospiraceae bacterium]
MPKDAGDLLIVMGGPMSVNDPDPWIAEETAFIKRTLEVGKPVVGVCLGESIYGEGVGRRGPTGSCHRNRHDTDLPH